MVKKKYLILGVLNLTLFMVLGLFTTNSLPELVRGTSTDYTIFLDQSNRATISESSYGTGSETIHSVIFDYINAHDNAEHHTQLESGAIFNDASTQITSILLVTAVYAGGSLTLTTGDAANPSTNAVSLETGVGKAVSGNPYFFKIESTSAVTYLTSLSITYSCVPKTSSSSSSSSSGDISSSNSSSLDTVTYDHFYKQTAPSVYDYYDIAQGTGAIALPSTGTQKLLVIPVEMTGYPFTAQRLTDIAAAFVGDAVDTGWQSVKSFYVASSFGALTLDITISSPYSAGYTPLEMASMGGGDDGTYTVLHEAVAWYKTQNTTELTEFDGDGDGYIDNVWMVYSCPNYQNDPDIFAADSYNNPFWAFTYWDYGATANTEYPVPRNYAWASYDFMYKGYGTSLVDAHVYIHETGHILGLDDYYNYSRSMEGFFNPAGQIDMMDRNITDHDVFSKMALGWTKPYVVTGNAEITINPSQIAGDCILIPRVGKTYAGHPFDEYILLELYTPTGLNESDATNKYGGSTSMYPLAYTVPGIKLYHMDARFAHVNLETWSFGPYTTTLLPPDAEGFTIVGNSNASGLSAVMDFSLIHVIEAGGTNTFKTGNPGTNSTLFKTEDTFSMADYGAEFFPEGLLMNDGSAFGYSISFINVSMTSATIRVSVI